MFLLHQSVSYTHLDVYKRQLEGSARTYSQKQLNAWKNEKVEYNGKKISKYEATQIQRRR